MPDSGKYVYLDYAASTPLCEEALQSMRAWQRTGRDAYEVCGNPNSLSMPGRKAFKEIEQRRSELCGLLNANRPAEIAFTSGATEADNSCIKGIALAMRNSRQSSNAIKAKPKVIVSSIEHDAVLNPARSLRGSGFEVVEIPADRDGFITARALEEVIDTDTVLVSVQMANSEVGSIHPIRQLADIAHEYGAIFHTDAAQALGKIDVDLAELGCDAASFSSHKTYGPRGIGAMYIKAHTPFLPHMHGGGQESGLRSGTQDVCAIAGFASAVSHSISNLEEQHDHCMHLRDMLYAKTDSMPDIDSTVYVEKGSLDYLPNISNLLVNGIESQTLVMRLDELGFAVSGGSACSSRSLDPSHVLTAMGIDRTQAQCELRVSFGRYSTEEDIELFCEALRKAIDWK